MMNVREYSSPEENPLIPEPNIEDSSSKYVVPMKLIMRNVQQQQ
jgi:hypothetical protein